MSRSLWFRFIALAIVLNLIGFYLFLIALSATHGPPGPLF